MLYKVGIGLELEIEMMLLVGSDGNVLNFRMVYATKVGGQEYLFVVSTNFEGDNFFRFRLWDIGIRMRGQFKRES